VSHTAELDGFDAQRTPIPSPVLGMAIFLATEAMFFAGLISAFWVLRAEAITWPPPGQPRLPIEVTAVNTLLLLASGATMQRAVSSLRAGERGAARWLGVTLLLGAAFLTIQGVEWLRLIGFGLTTGSGLYGATFYALIGAHALHVCAAVIPLGVALLRIRRGRVDATWLEPVRMYWTFVVAVWPVLYVLVYLA
jgi:heme/copper-type cytochrome/quinol oxidase subunit 3